VSVLVAEILSKHGDYPSSWESTVVLPNGTPILVRPIRTDDESLVASFVQVVSVESARNRFLGRRKLTPADIHQLTHIDYRKEMAFIAIATTSGEPAEIGVARYVCDEFGGEFAVLILDAWQGLGVGRVLLAALAEYASSMGVEQLHGITYTTNKGMLGLARTAGFEVSLVPGEAVLCEMKKRLVR
jgi:acetyltransferase